MDCYGSLFNKRAECGACQLRKWCRDALDPPRLSHQMVNWDAVGDLTLPLNMTVSHPSEDENVKDPADKRFYSRNDLLEVIGFLMAMDLQTLDMLDAKISDPGVSFSEIARQRGVSRQAVHKYIKKKCAQIPELSTVLQNYTQKHKSYKNFMEEVCRIKKQMSAKRLRKRKEGLKYSRKLICWNRNLDLSKMSIFRGSVIIGNASKV